MGRDRVNAGLACRGAPRLERVLIAVEASAGACKILQAQSPGL